jgi:hypothetical protein
VYSGKVSAAQIAESVFDAIRQGAFYIYSHPNALGAVKNRFDDIVTQRNPTDPFTERPEVRADLVRALRTL